MGRNTFKDKVAEQLEAALDTGVDTKSRTVYFVADVEPETARKFVVGLRTLDQTPGDITVFLNSPGGYVYDGFAMFEAIKMTENPVTVVGTGMVMSMGAAVIQAADKRILTPYSSFMVHNGYDSFEGESDRVAGWVKENNRLNTIYHKILADRSGLPLSRVKVLCKNETFMSPETAKELNLIDEVSVWQ